MSAAVTKYNIDNDVAVAPDRTEALDFRLGTESNAGRDLGVMSNIILPDLKQPKVDGPAVLHRQ